MGRHQNNIKTVLQREVGIEQDRVISALLVLERLGLCHQVVTDTPANAEGVPAYIFPGALAASGGRLYTGRPLPSRHHPPSVGSTTLVGQVRLHDEDAATTIFSPGMLPRLQAWALQRYPGTHIWRDGLWIPFEASGTLAEAGIQLHRQRSTAHGGATKSVMLVVRGQDDACGPDCVALLNGLHMKLMEMAGVPEACLLEHAVPPTALGDAATAGESPLDLVTAGYELPSPLVPGDPDAAVIVGGMQCTVTALRNGDWVEGRRIVGGLAPFAAPSEWVPRDGDFSAGTNPDDTVASAGANVVADVSQGSPEFDRIEANMHRSLPNAVIRRIERVQNKSLWRKYAGSRADVAVQRVARDGALQGRPIENQANEVEVWHATRSFDPRPIVTDWRSGLDLHRSMVTYTFDDQGRRRFKNTNNKSCEMPCSLHPSTFDTSTLGAASSLRLRIVSHCVFLPMILLVGHHTDGTGIYGAKHAIYPDTLLAEFRVVGGPDAGCRQMLLLKMTLGEPYDHGSNIPNEVAAVEREGYHSTTGTEEDCQFKWIRDDVAELRRTNQWTQDHPKQVMMDNGAEYGRQYVVHRNSQHYPAYLVTYANE